jgi:hypothetical protein
VTKVGVCIGLCDIRLASFRIAVYARPAARRSRGDGAYFWGTTKERREACLRQSGVRFARLVYHTAEAVFLRDRRWPVERLRYMSEGASFGASRRAKEGVPQRLKPGSRVGLLRHPFDFAQDRL